MPRAPSPNGSKEQDAIALLTQDHKKVAALFKEFEKLMDADDADDRKAQLAEQICNELTVHAQIEEEIFYPAVREAIDDDDLLDEAEVEHGSLKELIAQLESMTPDEPLFDAKVTVLGEYVTHHVDEEQSEMFKKVRAADVDTIALGIEMGERKRDLMAEMGMDDGDHDDARAPEAGKRKKPGTGARK